MSSTEHTSIESKRNVYDTCDPIYLRELRESAGMDVVVLARTACLSVAQVRQLETDASDNLFYSDAIKRQAYKRLLMILGAEPPTVEVPEEFRDASKVAEAHLNTLDQIVAMSHQPAINRSVSYVLASGFAKSKEHKQFIGALLFLLCAVGLFVLQGLQPAGDSVAFASSESASAAAVTTPASATMASVPMAQPVTALVAEPVAAPVASTLPAPAVSVAAPVAALPTTTTAPAANNLAGCAYVSDALPQLTPFIAQKEGRYVYVVSPTNAEICVVDGNKQATLLQMKAGENRSVYGVSPWQVSGLNLPKVQIFFQGGRVSVPEAATRVKLVEVPVSR